jgi:predicted transcriptional regulator
MIVNTAVDIDKLAETLMEADQHQAMVNEAIAAAGFTKDDDGQLGKDGNLYTLEEAWAAIVATLRDVA